MTSPNLCRLPAGSAFHFRGASFALVAQTDHPSDQYTELRLGFPPSEYSPVSPSRSSGPQNDLPGLPHDAPGLVCERCSRALPKYTDHRDQSPRENLRVTCASIRATPQIAERFHSLDAVSRALHLASALLRKAGTVGITVLFKKSASLNPPLWDLSSQP